jgi:CubicO group peptidase (beta-lactamase class C family)
MLRYATILILLVAVSISCASSDQGDTTPNLSSNAAVAQRIDDALAPYFSDDKPGIAAIAAIDGEVVFRKGYGLANVEVGVPIEPHMVFRIASITKEFTAVLIMQLIEQGKLALDDDITNHLPDYPTQGHTVTIAHLLSHTSGIVHFTKLEAFQENIRKDHTVEETIAIFKDEPFGFAPGERYSYSSSGYVLLGAIIEAVTGKTYEEALREHIFDVLGMATAQRGGNDKIIPGRVNGYAKRDDELINDAIVTMTAAFSTGSLVMSVDDLAKWDEALYTNQLLSDASKQLMWTPFVLNNGDETRYGLGWSISRFLGYNIISHSGSIDGFTSQHYRVPGHNIYAAVFANTEAPETSVTYLIKKIVAIALGVPEKQSFEMTEVQLAKYAGPYRREDGRVWKAVLEEGKLFLAPSATYREEMIPESETSFFFPESFHTVTFDLDDDGQVLGLVFELDGGRTIQTVRE